MMTGHRRMTVLWAKDVGSDVLYCAVLGGGRASRASAGHGASLRGGTGERQQHTSLGIVVHRGKLVFGSKVLVVMEG